ncbi:MAG: PilZ domain-containing protein [Desulfobaccales bacterium]
MERRRHKRIFASIPVKIHVQRTESPKDSWSTLGVLKDISYEGAYFSTKAKPPLEQGQIKGFTITPAEENPNLPGITLIDGTGRVVRIDIPQTGFNDTGVALEFISAKLFDCLIKDS